MPDQKIFRDAALERLASPERLDQLITVTSPKAWFALAAFGALLLSFTGWGLLGRVSTRVEGQGILLTGDVYEVVPRWPGRVAKLHVRLGEEITPGQLVAELEQPQLKQQIQNAEARLGDLKEEFEYLRSVGDRELDVQRTYQAERRAAIQRNIDELEELDRLVTAQASREQRLFDEGGLTQEQLIPTQQALTANRAQLANSRAELTQVRLDELNANLLVQRRLIASEQGVHEAERQLGQLQNDYVLQTRVYAAQRGRILEITVDEGSVIVSAQALMKVTLGERGVGKLKAVVFVNGEDGKRVESGMTIQVAPAMVRPEEYGYMLGEVVRIAEFPATPEGMRRVLKNDQLVAQLSALGAPFQVDVHLRPDTSTNSGYAWTSGRGPDVDILDGTPAVGRIIVERRRPVEMVIPGLRKLFGLH